jgi:hypothetical protein
MVSYDASALPFIVMPPPALDLTAPEPIPIPAAEPRTPPKSETP